MKIKKIYTAFLLGLITIAGSIALADEMTFSASDDAFVGGFSPNVNYGDLTFARIRWQSDDGWGRNYPLYKFDLSALPPVIWVNFVRMRFYVGLSDDLGPGWVDAPTNFCPVAVYKNLENWEEMTVTYSNRPACSATPVQILDWFGLLGVDDVFFTYDDLISSGGWLDYWDGSVGTGIKDMVQEWADGSNNYGVTIKGTEYYTSSSRYFDLQTKENPATSVQPALIIDYTEIPEPAALALLGVFVTGFLAARRGINIS